LLTEITNHSVGDNILLDRHSNLNYSVGSASLFE